MKILEFLSAEKLKANLVRIAYRFPVSLIIILGITILFFILLRADLTHLQEDNLLRYIFSGIITFFFSLGMYLASENFEKIKINKQIFQAIPIGFGLVFLLTFKTDFDNIENLIYFILTLVGIVGFLFISPFLQQILKQQDSKSIYYSFFYNMSVVFLISFILGGVLFALGAIGISAVFALFDITGINNEKLYGDWAILSLSLITPIFALTQTPEKETFHKDGFVENAFFSFLVKYIATPFIYIYFVILYAYSVKVLMHFSEWPKGEVSWMVIGFSIFGYLIYMFSSIFEEENKFIRFFRKCFPFVVIPQLFMLFYAIGLRIGQYDITMNRYFVVVFGIWLGVISSYFIISKQKNIYTIPAVLTVFTILISLGPWGVYSLPESRQLQRLENNLTKANILKNGEIIPLKNFEDIDANLSKEIYGGIDYLCNYNDCKTIKVLFKDIYEKLEKKSREDFELNKQNDLVTFKDSPDQLKSVQERIYNEPSRWEIVSEVSQTIKVKSYFDNYDETMNEILYFYSEGGTNTFPLDVTGYTKLYRLDGYYEKGLPSSASFDLSKKTISLQIDGSDYDTIDITTVIEKITSEYKNTKKTTLSKDNMVYELSGKKGKYKLILENISLRNPFYKGSINETIYNNVSGYILLK